MAGFDGDVTAGSEGDVMAGFDGDVEARIDAGATRLRGVVAASVPDVAGLLPEFDPMGGVC